MGGEKFSLLAGLAGLLNVLKDGDLHTAVYSGYTLEVLSLRPVAEVEGPVLATSIIPSWCVQYEEQEIRATACQGRRTMVSLSIVDSLHHHDFLAA